MADPELHSEGTVIQGVAHNGKPCRVVDQTGRIDTGDLKDLLATLIEQRRFGLSGLSALGGNTISMGAPEFGHIQIGDRMYRMTLRPYEAIVERF